MSFKRFQDRQRRQPPKDDIFEDGNPVRLNRFIAASGLCSRRKADDFIKAGRVKVNGDVTTELGTKVNKGDVVFVNGKRLDPSPKKYLLLNKTRNTITTVKDDRGRATVLDTVGPDSEGLFPVGRLDRNTEGLLILTNDGDLAHRLTHPSFGVQKIYEVGTEEIVTDADLQTLRTGVELDDGVAKADRVTRVDGVTGNIIALAIHEGRNRQVRRMMEAMGYKVKLLRRVKYGNLTIKGVRKGRWRILTPKEIRALRRSVGLKDLQD